MIESEKLFAAEEAQITIYNATALLNETIIFLYDDEDETDFDFPGYVSGFFRIYNSRGGKMVKNYTTQVSKSAPSLILNCSVLDMTFSETGKRYFELGYVISGGYDRILRYGDAFIV